MIGCQNSPNRSRLWLNGSLTYGAHMSAPSSTPLIFMSGRGTGWGRRGLASADGGGGTVAARAPPGHGSRSLAAPCPVARRPAWLPLRATAPFRADRAGLASLCRARAPLICATMRWSPTPPRAPAGRLRASRVPSHGSPGSNMHASLPRSCQRIGESLHLVSIEYYSTPAANGRLAELELQPAVRRGEHLRPLRALTGPAPAASLRARATRAPASAAKAALPTTAATRARSPAR